MFPVIDITPWERLGPEPMGTKRKFWCLDGAGNKFLFKESRTHSGEHWSEKVAEQIAGSLGLPHAEIEFANCEGRRGTISRNFLLVEGQDLVHGNELLFEQDQNYPRHQNFRLAAHTLDRIFSQLQGAHLPFSFRAPDQVESASDLFVGYLLLDALIVNTDRHHENWAVVDSLQADNTYRRELAPTFDHASSLGRELTDDKRGQKLHAQQLSARRDQSVVGYLESDKGGSRIYLQETDQKPLPPMKVFRHVAERYSRAAEAWLEQLSVFSIADFRRIVEQVPHDQMSELSREFCLCLLELNRTALLSRRFEYD